MLLSEAIEALATATKVNGRSAQTVKDYRRRLGYLLAFLGDVQVETITVHDLRRYVAYLMDRPSRYDDHHLCAPRSGGLSPFTVASHVRSLKRLFNWLVEEEVIITSPTRRIKTPSPRRRNPKGITRDDLLALLKTTEGDELLNIRDRALILFLTDTGCRVGGLCGLTLNDVDLDKRLATVTEKGEKTRSVPFGRLTAAALRAWLDVRPSADTDAFFLSVGTWGKLRGPLETRGVSQMLNRRARRVGIEGPVNPHSFRHAFARDFLMDGGDLGSLADLLGHSSVLVTKEFYGVFTMQELQEKHAQHSPVAQLFERGGQNGDESINIVN